MNRKQLKNAARESLKDAGSGPKKVTLIFLVSYVIMMVLCFVLTELVGNIDTGSNYLSKTVASEAKVMVLNYIISYGMEALMVLLTVGYTAAAMDMRDQRPVAYDSLLSGTRMAGRVILLYVLKSLYVGLWTYVFAIPLSYLMVMDAVSEAPLLSETAMLVVVVVYVAVVMFMVSYRYRMAYFVLLDEPNLGTRAALRKASAINRGHRMQLFLLDLSFLPWILLSILTCGILLIWKLPYMITTYAHAYEAMKVDFAKKQEHYRELQERMLRDRTQ